MRRRAIMLLVAVVGTLVVGSGVALAASITCTLNPCLGTSNPDTINGTDNYDEVYAGAGNDTVFPLRGDDTVFGGEGNDIVFGFAGQDVVYGGPEGDGSALGTNMSDGTILNLEGGQDSDSVYGGGGADYIDAAANDEPLEYQTEPVDYSYGQGGNDRIYAVDGNEDIIDCDKGTRDVAFIDKGIDTTTGCEKVFQAVTRR